MRDQGERSDILPRCWSLCLMCRAMTYRRTLSTIRAVSTTSSTTVRMLRYTAPAHLDDPKITFLRALEFCIFPLRTTPVGLQPVTHLSFQKVPEPSPIYVSDLLYIDLQVFCLIHKMDLIPSGQRNIVFVNRKKDLEHLSKPMEVKTYHILIKFT